METEMKVKLKIKQVNRNTQNSSLNAAPLAVEGGKSGGSFDWSTFGGTPSNKTFAAWL